MDLAVPSLQGLKQFTKYSYLINIKCESFYYYFIFYNSAQACQLTRHLFCTLLSENQGLHKSRSVSNLRKISGPEDSDKLKKRFLTEFFLRFESDLGFSGP